MTDLIAFVLQAPTRTYQLLPVSHRHIRVTHAGGCGYSSRRPVDPEDEVRDVCRGFVDSRWCAGDLRCGFRVVATRRVVDEWCRWQSCFARRRNVSSAAARTWARPPSGSRDSRSHRSRRSRTLVTRVRAAQDPLSSWGGCHTRTRPLPMIQRRRPIETWSSGRAGEVLEVNGRCVVAGVEEGANCACAEVLVELELHATSSRSANRTSASRAP